MRKSLNIQPNRTTIRGQGNMSLEGLIRSVFLELGFVKVGFLNRKDAQFEDWISPWLDLNFHGEMKWMERNNHIRRDPCSIEPQGKSIITLAFPYYTRPPIGWKEKNPISNYAWGEDYHKILKKKN